MPAGCGARVAPVPLCAVTRIAPLISIAMMPVIIAIHLFIMFDSPLQDIQGFNVPALLNEYLNEKDRSRV
jgi:hypothetical protein